MKSYTFFNFICIVLIFSAVFGTFYFVRGYLKQSLLIKENADIPVALSRLEIEKKLQTTTYQILNSRDFSEQVATRSNTSSSSIKDIPDSINLDVPFTSQAPEKDWSQPWQDACEEAAIIMLDAYQNDKTISIDSAKRDILSMVKWEENLDWGRSIELEKIEKIFIEYLTGYRGKLSVLENPTIDQIKKYIANGHPVFVVADGKILPNSHFQNGGPPYHALIIRGYTKDSFITNDPGTQFGQNYKYKYKDLMNAIHDWNGGDVKSGRPVILVVE